MLYCGIGAASLVSAVRARKQARAANARRPVARIAVAAAAALSSFLAGSVFVSVHLGHYMDRAQANERTLLAEFLAQPICTGARPR